MFPFRRRTRSDTFSEFGLNPLEEWILENGSEDTGLVSDLPRVAERLLGEAKGEPSTQSARAALTKLVDRGLLSVGTAKNAAYLSIDKGDLLVRLEESTVWAHYGSSDNASLEYWATEAGEKLNRKIDQAGLKRASGRR